MRALTAALLLGLVPSVVSAQAVVGGLAAGPVIADGDVGGMVVLDLAAPVGPVRVGGFVGATIVPSPRDTHNRIAAPLGVGLSGTLDLGGVWLTGLGRAGLWAGATQEVKLTAGGFVGLDVLLGFELAPGLAVEVGAGLWGFLGEGATWAFVPMTRLHFGEPTEDVRGDDDE